MKGLKLCYLSFEIPRVYYGNSSDNKEVKGSEGMKAVQSQNIVDINHI